MERPPLNDGNSRGSLRGDSQDLESCGSRLTGKNGKRMGYQICSAPATRLSLSVPLIRRRFFFLSNLVRTIGSWTAGSSTHPSSTSVMSHPSPNEEAVGMCRLKGTPNDRHQSGGRCERRRRSLVVGELWKKHVVRFAGSAEVGSHSSLARLRTRSGRMGWVTKYPGISVQPAEYDL